MAFEELHLRLDAAILMSGDKRHYYDELKRVQERLTRLPAGSQIRAALTDEVVAEIRRFIDQTSPADLLFNYWPPLYGLLCILPDDALAALDADLDLVARHGDPAKLKELIQFLRCKRGEKAGHWYGGVFDLWAKGQAIRSGLTVGLDHLLTNGRDNDVVLNLRGREFHLEHTAITQDDEGQAVWDRFLVDKRLDPAKVLMRPGAYCPAGAKGPSPYYDALRLYAKVFDKIAKDLDPQKSQCLDGAPNILLVSFAGPGVNANSPSVGWVLDELFADQPKMVRTAAPDGITDISLDAWIEFRANELIRQGKMTVDWYCEHWNRIMSAQRQLSAMMLFDGCRIVGSRINYNANAGSRISHSEMAAIEEIYRHGPAYWR